MVKNYCEHCGAKSWGPASRWKGVIVERTPGAACALHNAVMRDTSVLIYYDQFGCPHDRAEIGMVLEAHFDKEFSRKHSRNG